MSLFLVKKKKIISDFLLEVGSPLTTAPLYPHPKNKYSSSSSTTSS